MKGPWRLGAGAKKAAEADARGLCEAFDSGGDTAMQAKKAEQFKFAEETAKAARQARKGSTEHDFVPALAPQVKDDHSKGTRQNRGISPPAKVIEAESASPAPTASLSARAAASTQIEGPGTTPSSKYGYRCNCEFPHAKESEGARPRKPVAVKGPWRGGPDARAWAERDARALWEAFDSGGHEAMRRENSEQHRMSEVSAGGGSVVADSGQHETLIEEDGSRGYRAQCTFQVPRKPPLQGDGTYPVQIAGPWRRRRSEAESDGKELHKSFEEGGISKANARRMEMRREQEAGPQSEDVPSGQLSDCDMVNRYGKGFAMLAGMGFSTGEGLGREGQGRKVPVEASGGATEFGRYPGLGFATLFTEKVSEVD